MPLSNQYYEQESGNTLRIKSVALSNLGVYTCQAYNGIGKPAEWSMILQAIGPISNLRPDQEKYGKYLVQAPQRPERPSYPYRPNRTQTHENQTYTPVLTTRPDYYVPGVIPINSSTPAPNAGYDSESLLLNLELQVTLFYSEFSMKTYRASLFLTRKP